MIVTVDFETNAIEPRPAYPPAPVGVALREDSGKPRYLAWGHPHDNNCTKAEARAWLQRIWREHELLFHHAMFDLEVALVHLDLPLPPWHRVHDTLFLAFLQDPNRPAYKLKELGRVLLDRPPDEQARLRDWVVEHVPRASVKNWGAYIAQAPASLVAPYAKEDVLLTSQLFRKLKAHAGEAYDRERKLLPILMGMSREGIPLDEPALHHGIAKAEADLERVDLWLRRRLKKPELDLDKGEQLADALEDQGLVTGDEHGFDWLVTEKTQKRSTAIPALREVVNDQRVVDVLEFRSLLANQLRTFARPWAGMGGKICNEWHQVKHHEAGNQLGARTGRISSTPNLQNVPYRLRPLRRTTKGEGLYLPVDGAGFIDLRALVRAPRGQMLGDADYSQQELRVLAHFAGGVLRKAYQDNPRLDMHLFAKNLINERLRLGLDRDQSKGLGLGLIYGMGLDSLAQRVGTDVKTAGLLRRAYKKELDLERLERELRERKGCLTWGGRWYDVEEPTLIKGELRFFEYKLINTLVQGSSADVTKEAMIRYDQVKVDGRLLLTVHDELVLLAPTKALKLELRRLCEAMASVELTVPMIADGKGGRTWRDAH